MCVEEEEMIKTKKSDFPHAVIDVPKPKKIKDNGKDKNKIDMIFGVNKINTSGTKYTPEYHH
jgi:hypothetical protein